MRAGFFGGLISPIGLRNTRNAALTPARIFFICFSSPFHVMQDALRTAFWYAAYTQYSKSKLLDNIAKPVITAAQSSDKQNIKFDVTITDDIQDKITNIITDPLFRYEFNNVIIPYPFNHTKALKNINYNPSKLLWHYLILGRDPHHYPCKHEYSKQDRKRINNIARKQFDQIKDIQPLGHWLSLGIPATIITAFFQGAAVQAASYGLGLLCSTYIAGLGGTITHGVTSSLVGYYLGSGRGWSGTVSGLMVGANAFAIQAYALPALANWLQNICPLSDTQLYAIGFGMTAIATMLIESVALCTTRKWEDYKNLGAGYHGQTKYSIEVSAYSEYTTFAWLSGLMGEATLPDVSQSI